MGDNKTVGEWDDRFICEKLESYNGRLNSDYKKKIFEHREEEVLKLKKEYFLNKKKIEKEFTINKKQILERISLKKKSEKKKLIRRYMEQMRKKWEKKKMLVVPFFRELLKNIEFSLNDSDLLKKIEKYFFLEIPNQLKKIDSIDMTKQSISNCYVMMKETLNKMNSFCERKEIDSNLLLMIDLIDDYRNLCLILFEKLVAWKYNNEFFTDYLFEGKQLYQLKLFVWRNKNYFKEIFMNYKNLHIFGNSNYIALSENDLFFLKVYFKLEDRILTLRNEGDFLERVRRIEKLFQEIDTAYMGLTEKYNIQASEGNRYSKIEISDLKEMPNTLNKTDEKIVPDDIIILNANENYHLEPLDIKENRLKKFFYYHILSVGEDYKELINTKFRYFSEQINNASCPKFFSLKIHNLVKDKEIDKEIEDFLNIVGLFVFDQNNNNVKILHYSIKKNFNYIDFFYQTLYLIQKELKPKSVEFTLKKSNSVLFKNISEDLRTKGFKVKNVLKENSTEFCFYLQSDLIYKKVLMSMNMEIHNIQIKKNEHSVDVDITVMYSNRFRIFFNERNCSSNLDLSPLFFYTFLKYFENEKKPLKKLLKFHLWKHFQYRIENSVEKLILDHKDILFEKFTTYKQITKFFKTFPNKLLIENSLKNDDSFKLVIGSLKEKLICSNCFIVNINNTNYLRIAPGNSLYILKGRKFEFELYLVATQKPDFFFYFVHLKNLKGLLWKKNYQVEQIVFDIFIDFDYNKLTKADKPIYIECFELNFRHQKHLDILNVFSHCDSNDISSVESDLRISINGLPENNGIIYNLDADSVVFQDDFLFGIIHSGIDKEIKFPVFSYIQKQKN